MAIYKLFPEKDATIYSGYSLMNTGLDEILEASTFYDTNNPEVSRYLLKFSQDEINDLLDNKIGTSSYQVNLRNYIANITGLNSDTTLEVYAISGSWNMGTGRYSNLPQVKNGVSWKYRTTSGSGEWATSFSSYVTASYISTNPGGGTWYTGSSLDLVITASQTLNYSSDKDLNVNVTNIIKNWYSSSQGGFVNDGFIIKQSNLNEFVADQNYVTTIKYFSIDTHTIYPPCLEFRWQDYNFNTGSSTNTIISSSQLVATLNHNSGYYRLGSVEKFRVNCRPQFPPRTFQTASAYITNYYLPTASYYAIKDLDTNEFIIDFDTNYTQISADSESSYFTLYMNGLEPERYYQVLIKTIIGNETLILDDDYYFKVING
jgi:hypothetical protein